MPPDFPMVSVIVLTYNHSAYIRQALDSILEQETTFDYEILVGDDASTDGTQEILIKYAERYPGRFRLFLREKNLGASRNAYELLTAARGKYLATCEGDDYWTDREKLEIQVKFLESHSQFIGCTHPFLIVDEFGNPLKKQHLNWVKNKKIFKLIDFQGLYLPGQPATFVRRNIFLNSHTDYSDIYKINPMIADRTLIMLFLCQGDFYRVDRNMSCYRRVFNKNHSITSKLYQNNIKRIEMDYDLNCKLEEYAKDKLKQPLRFERRRKALFADALIFFLKNRSRSSWNLTKKILKDGKKTFQYIGSFPYFIGKKVFEKFR